eukprot:GGOE01054017.1.p1 GENE.GGOE01054017.1~~GGOE01054017.1.p1  ORF type:complete len:981 (-),score=246.15 GGOE01054017.1:238-2787(-)
MDTVVTEFKQLASGYADQVRADLTAKGTAVLAAFSNSGASITKRLQQLITVAALDLSRTPTDPVGEKDCVVLGILCDSAAELGAVPLVLVAATGRLYRCGSLEGGTISHISHVDNMYNESFLRWRPLSNPSSVTGKAMKQRCLSEPPEVEATGLNCLWPQSCQCGADQRCNLWYQRHIDSNASRHQSMVYPDQFGLITWFTSCSLFNASAKPPVLLGVVESDFNTVLGSTLISMVEPPPETHLAMFLNDANLSVLATNGHRCEANETAPGDTSVPVWSALRSCEPGLRDVALQLASRRPVTKMFTVNSSGLVWDVSPVDTVAASYFFVVGYNRSLIDRPIENSEAVAFTQLNTVRTALVQQVAADGAATRAYVADVGAQNILATQAMQDSFLMETEELQNTSLHLLADSQRNIDVDAQTTMSALVNETAEQKATHFAAMSAMAGITIAILFSFLLAVLLVGVWGTIRVTNSLTGIIALMEDVADMKVENLNVPQGSGVQEVARIQTAFQIMVQRLAAYKSYLPAAVLEELGQQDVKARGTDSRLVRDTGGGAERLGAIPSLNISRDVDLTALEAVAVGRRPGCVVAAAAMRKQVAVLSVNVVGFMDWLATATEGISKSIINEYVAHVHEAVLQSRGNIDFLAGDQIFVTFNAHLPCGDPAGAAAAGALDVQKQVLNKLGDQLKFQIGVSLGMVFASSVGYAKFKFMVTVGSPMKVASVLSHRENLRHNGTILVDAGLEERIRYSHRLQPVELLYLPWLKSFADDHSTSQRIFVLVGKERLQEGEWLYQVGEGGDVPDWNIVFDRLVATASAQEQERLLLLHLEDHPDDEIALRLRDCLALWIPGHGIPS